MTRHPCLAAPCSRAGCGVCTLVARDSAFKAGFAAGAAKRSARGGAAPPDPGGDWLDIPAAPPLDGISPQSRYALVTVVVGDEAERCFAASGSHMRRYAAEHGADFHVSRWPGHPGWPMSAKFGVARFLDHYDQIAYVDADVLLRPAAVDVFDYVGPDGFGACDELPFHRQQQKDGYDRWRRDAGFPAGKPAHYFNAGVYVATAASRHLIDPPARLWVDRAGFNNHCAEQHLLNARVVATGFPVTAMPRLANWQSWTCTTCRGKAFKHAPADAVLHWSGDGSKRRRRADLIREVAAASPWPAEPGPFTPPAHLFADPRHPYYADPTHVGMLHAELVSGQYRRVLEIGCHHGYSTTAFLAALQAGKIGELHLCDPTITPELRRVIDHYAVGGRLHVHAERSADLLARAARFDFAFLDGDHNEATVREEVRRLVAAGCRTIAAHDVSPGAARYGVPGGPALVRGMLESAGYVCRVDDTTRPGERTERGLLIGTRGG